MAEEEVDLLAALIDTFDSEDDEEAGSAGNAPDKKASPSQVTDSLPVSTNQSVAVIAKETKKASVSAERVLEECDLFSSTAASSKLSLTEELFGDRGSDSESDDELIIKTELNSNGREISKLMKDREKQSVTTSGFYDSKSTASQIKNKWTNGGRVAHNVRNSPSIQVPTIGLAIVNPKVSMDFLKKAMEVKELIQLHLLKRLKPAEGKDWVTFGVITSKTETKRSSKGSEYIIFRIVDMAHIDDEITLFLFGKSYSTHWKLPVGTAIGLMNPTIMDNDKSKGRCAVTISICTDSQLMVVGTSKDLGTCGSITKNGNKCTNSVNKVSCGKCKFHAMQEHKAHTQKRAELNTAYGGREPVAASRDRLLSKLASTNRSDDCIIYGGQSFSSKQKPKTNVSLQGVLSRSAQRGNLQSTLNLYQIKAEDQEKLAASKAADRTKANEKLEELISRPSTATMQFMKHLVAKELKGRAKEDGTGVTVTSVSPSMLLQQEKERMLKTLKERKSLSQGGQDSSARISLDDFTAAKSAKTMTAEEYKQMISKKKALAMVRQTGRIEKPNVNAVGKKLTEQQKKQIKRKIDQSLNNPSNSDTDLGQSSAASDRKEKQPKLEKIDTNSEAYLALRNRKSINSHLVQQVQEERESQYFNVLEKKEGYETKLLTTHKIESMLYFCMQCDYQDWKLADRCRAEKHRYKKFEVLKKFFKCTNCKERVATHEKFPTSACKKCGGRNYSKAGMINEKKVTLAGEDLSLRGNEEAKLGCYDKINLDI